VAEPDDAVRLRDRLDGLDSVVVDDPEVVTTVAERLDTRARADALAPAFGLVDATAERVERLAATDRPPALAVTTGRPTAALHETCRDRAVRLLVADPVGTEQTGGDRARNDRRDAERAAVATHVVAGRVPLVGTRDPDRLVAALSGVHDARERTPGERA
jgi:hypothetical protein